MELKESSKDLDNIQQVGWKNRTSLSAAKKDLDNIQQVGRRNRLWRSAQGAESWTENVRWRSANSDEIMKHKKNKKLLELVKDLKTGSKKLNDHNDKDILLDDLLVLHRLHHKFFVDKMLRKKIRAEISWRIAQKDVFDLRALLKLDKLEQDITEEIEIVIHWKLFRP